VRLLVTGGAGYIGSVVARRFVESGHTVTLIDDLSKGHREAAGECELIVGDIGDSRLVSELLAGRRIEAVVHLAASTLVGESVQDPSLQVTGRIAVRAVVAPCDMRVLRFALHSAWERRPPPCPIRHET